MARWLWSRRSDDYRLSRSFALILLALGIERPHWPELQQSRLLRSAFTKVEFGPPVNVRGSLPNSGLRAVVHPDVAKDRLDMNLNGGFGDLVLRAMILFELPSIKPRSTHCSRPESRGGCVDETSLSAVGLLRESAPISASLAATSPFCRRRIDKIAGGDIVAPSITNSRDLTKASQLGFWK